MKFIIKRPMKPGLKIVRPIPTRVLKTPAVTGTVKHKGRVHSGSNNPHATFTESDVRDIRISKSQGFKREVVYAQYKDSISDSGFRKIWYNETWKDVIV